MKWNKWQYRKNPILFIKVILIIIKSSSCKKCFPFFSITRMYACISFHITWLFITWLCNIFPSLFYFNFSISIQPPLTISQPSLWIANLFILSYFFAWLTLSSSLSYFLSQNSCRWHTVNTPLHCCHSTTTPFLIAILIMII